MHEYGITPKTYTPHSVRDGFEAEGLVETPIGFAEMLLRYGPYVTAVFALTLGGFAASVTSLQSERKALAIVSWCGQYSRTMYNEHGIAVRHTTESVRTRLSDPDHHQASPLGYRKMLTKYGPIVTTIFALALSAVTVESKFYLF